MAQYLPLPDGSFVTVREGEQPADAWERAQREYPDAFGIAPAQHAPGEGPQDGFKAAFKGGMQRLVGETALGAGKIGLMDKDKAVQFQKSQEEKSQGIFQPGAESFSEAPWQYTKELLGQSLPYAVAPLAAAGAAAVGGLPAAAGLGAGLAASGAQFFGSNLSRQMEQGKTLDETSGGQAGAAAVGQAALEALTFRAIPGIGRLFGAVGAPITKETAAKMANQSVKQIAADITAATGKAATVGAVTEVFQQGLERLQADLEVASPEGKEELLQAAFGGALLSGVLAPGGRVFERRSARKDAERLSEEEQRAAAEQARAAQEASAQAQTAQADPRQMGPTRQIGAQQQIPGVDATDTAPAAQPLTPEQVQEQGSTLLQEKQYLERLLADKDTLYEREAAALAQGNFQAAAQAAKARTDMAARVKAIDAELASSGYVDYTKRSGDVGTRLAKVEAQLREQADPGKFDPARIDKLQKQREALLAEAQEVGAQDTIQPDMFGTIGVTGKSVQRNADADRAGLAAQMGGQRESMAQRRAQIEAEIAQLREMSEKAGRPQDETSAATLRRNTLRQRELQAEIAQMEQRAAGTATAAQQPRLFGEAQETARATRGTAGTARSEAQILADIDIARATQNRQVVSDLAEELRTVRDDKKKRDAEAKAGPQAVDIRSRDLEQAAGMRVPEDTAQRQGITDARVRAFGTMVSTLDRFNKGRADAGTLAAAEKQVVDSLVREIEALRGETLTPAERQDIMREARPLLNDLKQRMGDTRDEVNVGSIKDPDMRPVQRRSGQFDPDLPGTGAGPTGMGLENQETQPRGQRTFSNRYAAAQSIQEGLDDIRNRYAGTQESAPGVDRTDRTQGQDERLRTAQAQARGTAAEGLVQQVADSKVKNPELVDAAVQASMRAQRGQDIGEQRRTITDELARLEQGKRSETEGDKTAVQADLFGDTATAFNSYKDFEAYLAGDALAALKLANGGMRDSMSRVVKLVAPLQKRAGELEQRVAELVAKRAALEATTTQERAAASKQVADAEASLLEAQDAAEYAVSDYRSALAEAEAKLRTAHDEHAQLARAIADNVAALETTIASEKPSPALVAAKKKLREATAGIATDREKMATLMRSMSQITDLKGAKVAQYMDLQARIAAGTQQAVKAHGQLMAATRQQSDARAAAPGTAFLEFLIADGEMTAQRKPLVARIGGLTVARNRAQDRLDQALAQAAADPDLGGRIEQRRTAAALARDIQKGVEQRANARAGDIAGAAAQITNTADQMAALRKQSTGAIAREKQAREPQRAPTTKETQGDREARDGERRRAEQAALERVQDPTLDRTGISFEKRRQDREALQEAGDRMEALEIILSKVPMTPEQRAEFEAAQEEYTQRVAALEKRADARSATLEGKLNAQSRRVAALQAAQEAYAAAEVDTPARAAAEQKVQRLMGEIKAQGENISKVQGITRTRLLSKAEQRLQNVTRDGLMRINEDMDAFTAFTERQATRRASSPAVRETRQTGGFRTGVADTAEQRAGGQRSRIVESRRPRERNVQLRPDEMAAANSEAVVAQVLQAEIKAANKAAEAEKAKSDAAKEADVKRARAEAAALAKEEAAAFKESKKEKRPPSRWQSVIDAMESDSWDDNAYREGGTTYAQRAVTDLAPETQDAVQDGRLVDALDQLASNGSTPFVRELAGRLSPLMLRTKLKVQDGLNDNGAPVEGLYNASSSTVVLDSAMLTEEVLLHEAVHPATLRALDADPNTLTPEQRAARGELEQLYQDVKDTPAFKDEYAGKDVGEFAAELMSNPDVRAKLDGQPGVLRRMYNAILRMLGMNPKTVSEQAVANVYALFQPAKAYTRTNPVAVASVMRGIFPATPAKFNSDTPAALQSLLGRTVGREPGLADKVMANASGLALRTQFVDRFAPVEQLLRLGVDRGMLDSAQAFQTSYFLRFGEQRNQFVEQAATRGVPQLRRNADGDFMIETPDGDLPNIMSIAKELRNANAGNEQAAEQLFTTYLAVLRGEKVGFDKLNFDSPITPAQAQEVKQYVAADPQRAASFERARKMYREYNNDLLDLLVQTDAMAPAEAQRLKQGDYVPYYREDADGVVNLIVAGEQAVRIGNIKDQPYLRELVGGNDKILPFFTGAMQNTSMLMDMALRNQQTKDVSMTLSKMGVAKIGNGMGPNDKRNVVHFKVDGAHKFAIITDAVEEYGVPADLLVKGLEGIKTTLPAALRALQVPANLLRTMITRAPAYAMRQIIREPINAFLVTGGNFTPVASSVKELSKILQNKSPAALALERAGAVSSNVITGDTQDQARILRDIAQDKNLWHKTMMAADKFAMQGDTATRAVLYDTYRKKGMTHMQATLGSLEVMNFGRRGLSPSMQAMSMLVPFFNAQVQGMDVIYRAAQGTTAFEKKMDVQRKLVQRGALVAAATIAYVTAMSDDDAYKNATPEQRALNWFLPLPGLDEPLRVPIPFELGYAFKALPELMFNTAFGDTKAVDAAKAMGGMLYQTVPIGLPQAIKPALEVITNHSFFTGEDVETQGEQRLRPEERFRNNTTELTKLLGRTAGVSPVQVEHLVRGYTGGIGLTLVGLASFALRPLIADPDMPESPTKRMSELPLLGPLFQPVDGRGVINEAYKDIESWQMAQTTFNKMVKEGRRADALQFAQQHSNKLALNATGGAYRQQMGELAAVRKMIMADRAMSPAEKRQRVDQVRQVELVLARRVREVSAAAS
jgi:hypothetical protein